ncbi:phytanoyl-CoA dioxygenase [Pedobacter petrophilus]|uniref:Phytanoyl-CoA dioxygenase n=1 Tax=Pedobacter petrophilus TaxID=1908241 RepID=A0A7K0G586_9SPHI|nr:phytanoyl-CoA dioxygenase family protein [Pedobacter petrophilus]MRX78534.1 phytanoyl-CoA dioxygenase [Pedobacter petrophilus]
MASSYPTFTLSEKLSKEQIEFFNIHGFIHFKNFITKPTVGAIIQASEEVQKDWINADVRKINGVPIKYGKDINGEKIVQRFAFINQHHKTLSGLLMDPRLSALLPLAGDESRLGIEEKDGMVFNHYVNGPESGFTKMGWHTDGLRDIFYGGKLNPMLNVGVHLSTQTEANGGLKIIPGTHKQSIYQMLFRKRYFIDNRADKNEISILPEAGDLTVHDGRLWHRVAQSSLRGEESRRRVIYIPIIAGKYAPKNENSPTVFYQRFAGIVK